MVASIDLSAISFRAVNNADIDEILLIENLVYDFPWTRGIIFDCIEVGYECIALQLDSKLIGYSIMTLAAGEGHLLNLVVAPQYQRYGYGRSLLKYMLGRAKRMNTKTVFLEVRASNIGASKLYQSLNFHKIGIRKNYYPDKHGREHAVVYALDLADIE